MSTPVGGTERGTSAPALTLYYLLVYGAGGVTMPFLPQYLKGLGLSGTEVGFLLAMSPALSLVAPPFWGQLADRTGRPGRVLLVITAGATAAFALLLVVKSFPAVLLVATLYACFQAAISTLIDSTTLRHVARHGGSYARIRLWGSAGFAAASLVFGHLVDVIDRRVVLVALVLMGSGLLWTALRLRDVRASAATGPKPSLEAALGLAESHEMRIFLVAMALHWFASSPYHCALSIHATQLHLPTRIIGDAATVGVVSEIAVMVTWPRWGHLVRPRELLFVVFLASGVRWLGVALTTNGTVLVLLSLFHGLTFGVFFLSAVAFMTERVPETLRATGQSLFVASVFGVGALSGYLATGVGLDVLPSSNALFAISAGLEVIPAVLVLRLPRMRKAL